MTREIEAGNVIELTDGNFLAVTSYTEDGLMEEFDCTCHKHCYLANINKCIGHNLNINVIKNIKQYDLYSGNCPLANGLCFKELKGGI